MTFLTTQAPWVRYLLAVLAVSLAATAARYIPVVTEWGRGALLLFFFAALLATFWLGMYPGLLAGTLSIIGINVIVLAPVWGASPLDAIYLNSGFCILFAVAIAAYQTQYRLIGDLSDRERELQLIMDLSPDLTCYLDTEFRYIRANKTFQTWWGKLPGEIIGLEVREIVGEQTWGVIKPYLERARLGESVNFDHQIRDSQDSSRWVHVTYVPHLLPSGVIKGIFAQIANITELKLAENKLLEAEERMRLATQATGVGIWEWNLLANYIHWDSQMFRIFGIPPTQDGIVEYTTWSNAVLPEDLPRQEELVQETIRTAGYNCREYRIQRPDRKAIRHIQAVEIVRTNAHGQAEWMVGTNLDITDRKYAETGLIERENQLRLIMNLTPALISYLDTDLRYVRVNKTYEDWYGIAAKDIIGRTVPEIVGEKTWEVIQPYLERALKGERVSYEHKLAFYKGDARWVRVTLVPDIGTIGVVKGIVVHVADIDERIQTEQKITSLNMELENRVAEMQTILDTAPIGLCITNDTEALCISGNLLMERMFGLTPDSELSLGNPLSPQIRAFLDGQTIPAGEFPMQRAARGEKISNQILEFQNADGQLISLLSNAAPLFDGQGIPRGAIGAFLDITTLKKAESALRESEERLRLAQKAGALGIFDHKLLTNEIQWDSRLRELWGIKPHETVSLAAFMSAIHPDDRKQLKAAVIRSFDPQTNGEYHTEYRVIRPSDKQMFWLAAFGVTTFADDKPVRLVGFVQDISERKRIEATLRDTETRLNLAMTELKAGYWDWDLKTNEAYLSPVWKLQLGFEDHELPNHYEEWENRLHPDDMVRALATVDRYITGDLANYEIEFRLRHKDGSYRWIHSRAALFRDQNDQPTRLVGIHLDITDFKNLNEMNNQREKIEQTFRFNIANQTLAAIAHELNQPLTAVSYFADAAVDMVDTDDLKSQKLRRVLQNCSEQAQRAGQVIRQLLSVLQRSDTVSEEVDLNKSVTSVYNLTKAKGQLNGYHLKLDLANDLPQVTSNDLHIQKVLVTLISNGVESIQESGRSCGTVTIITGRSPNNPDMAQIIVCDNGIGVADDGALDKIFKPFYTTKSTGLGMGLAISRTMIETYGGTMWAEQNAGAGLSVHFTLPFAS